MTTHCLLNICLVPDIATESGQQFRREAVRVSQTLNQIDRSGYVLTDGEPSIGSPKSLTHCTVMHIRVSGDAIKSGFLGRAFAPLFDHSCVVPAHTFIAVPRQPQWNAVEMGKQGSLFKPQEGIFHNVLWWNVRLSQSMRDLQNNVYAALSSRLSEGFCLTRRGDYYSPHFTLWLKEMSTQETAATRLPSLTWQDTPNSMEVPCRLVIGNCGVLGQVYRTAKSEDELKLII